MSSGLRRSGTGRMLLRAPAGEAFCAIPHWANWMDIHPGVYSETLKAPRRRLLYSELQWMENRGYIARTSTAPTGAADFVRTAKPATFRGPPRASIWPYTVAQHVDLYNSSAWQQHREWVRKLTQTNHDPDPLTPSQIRWVRQHLELALNKTKKPARYARYIPSQMRWLLFFQSGIEYLLCSLLIMPEYDGDTFVRFRPMDPETAKQWLVNMTASSVADGVRRAAQQTF